MAESQCLRIKLKPGKTEEFVAWARSLPQRMDEINASLKAEGILAEHLFLDRSPAGDFVVFYTRAKNLQEASAAFQRSTLKVDEEARRVMAETWDTASITALEPLADLSPHSWWYPVPLRIL